MGTTDKVVRLLMASILVFLYYVNIISGTTAIIFMLIALVLALTSLLNSCPLYLPFGINTSRKEK